MTRSFLLYAFCVAIVAVVVFGQRVSRECAKERRELERFNPRFRIRPGTVSCHSLKRIVSKCGGLVSVPGNFSDAVYYGSTGSHYTLLRSQQGSQCTYRPNEQCTWRFGLPSARDAQIAFWKLELEHSALCDSDYIAIDFIVEVSRLSGYPDGCAPLRGKGKLHRSDRLCRIEHKLPCGAFCDPALTTDRCLSSFTCPSRSGASCRKRTTISESFSFNFSTANLPKLRGLNVKYIHVTFRADSTRQCRGFEGIFLTHEKRWRKISSLSGDESDGEDTDNYLPEIGKISFEKGQEVQKYNEKDLLIALSRAAQNSTLMERLIKHDVFKQFVKNQKHGLPLSMTPDIDPTSAIRTDPATSSLTEKLPENTAVSQTSNS